MKLNRKPLQDLATSALIGPNILLNITFLSEIWPISEKNKGVKWYTLEKTTLLISKHPDQKTLTYPNICLQLLVLIH